MRTVALTIGIFGLYVVAGKVGLAVAFVNPSASAVWAPTGIAIAAILVFGRRLWPAVLVGAFVVNVTTAGSIATSLGIAIGNTIEALVGAILVKRLANGVAAFERPRDVFWFTLCAGLLAPITSASIGVATLAIAGYARWADAPSIWLTWWLGDAVGALVMAPLIILWSGPFPRWTARKASEAAALLASVIGMSSAIFGGLGPMAGTQFPFIATPLLVWAALRFGPRETATATFLLGIIAVIGTLSGTGPFIGESPNDSLLLLQGFVGITQVTALVLAAAVTRQRRAEELARASDERLRLIAQQQKAEAAMAEAQAIAHVGSWEWDIASDQVSWSDELYRVFGVTHDDFRANFAAFLALVHPDDRPLVAESIATATAEQRPFAFYHRIVRPDGTTRVLHARGRVITDDAGATIRMVGTGRDVTEIQAAEEEHDRLIREHEARSQAEAALRERDEFLSIVAHELRTPITSLRLVAQHLAKRLASGTATDAALLERSARLLDVQTDKLARLVSDLLDLSRFGAGRLELNVEPTDIAKLVEDIVTQATMRAEHRQFEVHVDADTTAVVDAIRLEQVLTNLVENALKFGSETDPIQVAAQQTGAGQIAISVRDHGPGVAEEHRSRIFERFYQGQVHAQRPGLGLGLYISRQIVELHGGTLTAEFPTDGGSRFIVRIPTDHAPD